MSNNVTKGHERRKAVRLAGEGEIDAVVLDAEHRPVIRLEEPKVLNVSAGGLAMTTATAVGYPTTTRVRVHSRDTAAPADFEIKVLDCTPYRNDRHKLRCQLTLGRIPASLIYGW